MSEEMAAGRELDALVAKVVFDLTVRWLSVPRHPHEHGAGVPIQPQSCDPPPGLTGAWAAMYWVIPRYSTDIAAAWEVVEKLVALGFVTVHLSQGIKEPGWYASFFGDPATDGKGGYARADTAPLAICRAALKATTPNPDGESARAS